ncbi:M48 family metalloprotease [Parasphingorhabdus sp.]|uniref:M48 family metalloprotease n=1 Tax=Parasphingorhabdus sp. TaxID=2709688 RepID=UPI00329A35FA
MLRFFVTLIAAIAVAVQPVAAQSILRDAETEALFSDMVAPLVAVSELDADEVEVILINDNQINAFVAGGQRMFFYSGTLAAADSAVEIQGVMAHELGNITGGHIIRFNEGIETATGITILSLILGAAAIAAGAGEAGAGILAAGQQAALGKFLAFSRVQERSADAAGARYLSAAGITGRGSIDFFKKLQNYEFRLGIPQEDSYGRTHPLSGERVSLLRDVYQADPAWDTPPNPEIERRFQRVKAKLLGFTADPNTTLRQFPQSDQTVPARYARAYAWHKSAYPDKALEEVNKLLTDEPNDPYFLELQGQIMLESGRPDEALESLRKAVTLTNAQPLIAALFGHALIATEDETHFEEAETVLKAAVIKDNRNPFAWYQLGVVYSQKGDTARAQLATAESALLQRNYGGAIRSSQIAMGGIAENTPDWIRAQDISLIAKSEFERAAKRR